MTVLVTMATVWGLHISDQTQTAILTTAPVLIAVLNGAAELMREFVSPVPVVHAAIQDALEYNPNTPGPMPSPGEVLKEAK
jgi:hypothetical protein